MLRGYRVGNVSYRTVVGLATAHTRMSFGQWMFPPVTLDDMPKRMRRRVLRSVSRIEVDAVFGAEIPLRLLPGRVARLGRRLVNLRAAIPWINRHS
jgi:hypothetical protein